MNVSKCFVPGSIKKVLSYCVHRWHVENNNNLARKEGASYTYTMVSFNIYFFILNNTINILQTNIGFGRVTSSSVSLHFTIVDMTFLFFFFLFCFHL